MNTLEAMESTIRRLPREEVEKLQAWLQDYLEDERELTDGFKASIERGKRDITEGRVREYRP